MAEAALPSLGNISRATPQRVEAPTPRPQKHEVPVIPGLKPVSDLLIWQKRGELADAVQKYDTVILAAGTGTGKTRGGSQIMLDALGPDAKMVVTENLRRATEESAKVVAADRKSGLGDEVGVRNRLTHDFSEDTRLLFCPVQSLLVMMEEPDNTLLQKYDLIAMDEVHKESKANELAMIRLREIQLQRKELAKKGLGKPLKLVFVSATADKQKIEKNFAGTKTVEVEGANYPITEKYANQETPIQQMPSAAAQKVKESIAAGDQGNILVFMSGMNEIKEAAQYLADLKDVQVVPYYSAAPKEQQDELFANNGQRKVVLATNAAQEGLTLDINIVVDTCTYKHNELDVVSGRHYLTEGKAPKDHLTQRKGRIGRKPSSFKDADGKPIPDKYYALTTKTDWESRPAHEPAEMLQTDLSQEMLILMAQGKNVNTFEYINKPPQSHIDIAMKRLTMIGAVKDGELTKKGRLMAALQINPNLASTVASGAEYGALDQTASLAAMLETFDENARRGITIPPRFAYPDSDALSYVQMFKEFHNIPASNRTARRKWAQENGLNYWKMSDAEKLYNELFRIVKQRWPTVDTKKYDPKAFDRSVVEGFADGLVRYIGSTQSYNIDYIGDIQMGKYSALNGKDIKQFVTLDLDPIKKDHTITARRAVLNHAVSTDLLPPKTQAEQAPSTTAKAAAETTAPAAAATVAKTVEPAKPKEPEKPATPAPTPPPVEKPKENWLSRSFIGKFWKWLTA